MRKRVKEHFHKIHETSYNVKEKLLYSKEKYADLYLHGLTNGLEKINERELRDGHRTVPIKIGELRNWLIAKLVRSPVLCRVDGVDPHPEFKEFTSDLRRRGKITFEPERLRDLIKEHCVDVLREGMGNQFSQTEKYHLDNIVGRYTDLYLNGTGELALNLINEREKGDMNHPDGLRKSQIRTWLKNKLTSFPGLKEVPGVRPHIEFKELVEKHFTVTKTPEVKTGAEYFSDDVIAKTFAAKRGMPAEPRIQSPHERLVLERALLFDAKKQAINEKAEDIDTRAREIVKEWCEGYTTHTMHDKLRKKGEL